MAFTLRQLIFVVFVIIVNSYFLIFLYRPDVYYNLHYDKTTVFGRTVTYLICTFVITAILIIICFCFYMIRKNRIIPDPPRRNPVAVEFELHEIHAGNDNQPNVRNMDFNIVV